MVRERGEVEEAFKQEFQASDKRSTACRGVPS